jgi:outer membrane scaffolding protein for murein synthesis (MipA/OmpV family)
VSAGVTLHGVFNGHDMLSFGADARWDITGHGGGLIVSPAIGYFTPLSHAQVFGMQASAEWIDSDYANFNYAISPAGSVASGLPAYTAHGGFKSFGAGAFTARDLNGNFLDGGLAIGVGAYWSRLYGSAAETPMTRLRGRSSQWLAAAGLSYTF